MKTKAYTQQELNKERRELMDVQKVHGTSGKVGESGRCTMNIPPKAYFNAIRTEGGVRDGKTVWSDPTYRKDMCRRHPELVVKAANTDSRVGPMLGRAGENHSAIFGKGRFDDVEADNSAFLQSAAEVLGVE